MIKPETKHEILSQILELKKLGPSLETKKTIQKLQQKLMDLVKNET